MILLLATLGVAQADPFTTGDIPYTTDFSFNWTGIVSGSTSYTFETQTQNTFGRTCSDIDACMSGDFSTGNGGTGTYQTDLYTDNCVVVSGPTFSTFGFLYSYNVDCDVTQTLDFTYDITGAVYDGEAQCGTVNGDAVFGTFDQFVADPANDFFFGIQNRDYDYNPDTFTGTMSIPGGPTGTFTE